MRITTTIATAAAALLAGGLLAMAATPAHAEDEQAQPVLEASAVLDTDTAAVGDLLTLTVTVTNTGNGEAADVVRQQGGSGESHALIELIPADLDGPFTLPAGATHTLTTQVQVSEGADHHGYAGFAGIWQTGGNPAIIGEVASNMARAGVSVPGAVGDVHGVIFEAESIHGSPQGAPRVPGVTIIASPDGQPEQVLGETITDANGEFTFTDIPAGNVRIRVLPPTGWEAFDDYATVGTLTPVTDLRTSELFIAVNKTAEPPVDEDGTPTPQPENTTTGTAGAEDTGGEQQLPVTGAKAGLIAAAGALATAAGAGLLLATRRLRNNIA